MQEFNHLFPAFAFIKCRVVAIDMPGFGGSSGKRQSSRSEHVLGKDGPGEVVLWVKNQLNLKGQTHLGGYDWGATIALKMGIKWGHLFNKLILFLPSYSETTKDELKALVNHVLVLWAKQDQFHPWTKFKPLLSKIKHLTYNCLDIKRYSPEMSYNCYQSQSDQFSQDIIKFLTGVDPLAAVATLKVGKEEQVVDTKGTQVIQQR